MAQAISNLTSADKLLKDFYQGPTVEILNNSHPLLELVEKSTTPFSGRQVKFPIHTGRNVGVGNPGEGKAQPSAGSPVLGECVVASKLIQGVIKISDEIEAASKNDRGAFASAMKTTMEDVQEGLKDDVNRQLYGDGTGYLATMSTTTGTVTAIVVDDTRFFKKDMPIAIGTTAELASTTAESAIVSSVVSSTNTVNISSTAIVTGDKIVRGTAASNNYNKELTGLAALVGTGDVQGVTVSSYPEFVSTVNSNSGTARQLTLDLMIRVSDDVADACGNEPTLLLMHRSVRREYAALLQADVRYAKTDVETKLTGGFSKLAFAAGGGLAEIIVDRYCTLGTIYYLNPKDLEQYIMQDWGWREQQGGVLQPVAGVNEWTAQFQTQRNLGCRRRNSHGKLTDILATVA